MKKNKKKKKGTRQHSLSFFWRQIKSIRANNDDELPPLFESERFLIPDGKRWLHFLLKSLKVTKK